MLKRPALFSDISTMYFSTQYAPDVSHKVANNFGTRTKNVCEYPSEPCKKANNSRGSMMMWEPRCLISKMALPKDFIGTIEDDDEVAVVSEDTSSDEEVKVSYYDIL